MDRQEIQRRAQVILARYPDAEFVLTDFGRGGKVVFSSAAADRNDPANEFVIYKPAWEGEEGKSGPAEIGAWLEVGLD